MNALVCKQSVSSRGALSAVSARMRSFARKEDGSLLIYGLFLFMVMVLLTGVAIDLMRYEERRTRLQATIDRATLAAADLQQHQDPRAVVKDYFVKDGLKPPSDDEIVVTESTLLDRRRVDVRDSEMLSTWFMSLVGVPELRAPAAATAEESIGQIEISLVLDVSGSMNQNSKLTNLKPAAKAFVDKIFQSADADKISISIIPYATQVAVPPALMNNLNVTGEQTRSSCIEFEPGQNDFTSTAMSLGMGTMDRVYQRNGDFDPFYAASPPRLTNCPTEASREILPFSGDRAALKAAIDNLGAEGNTSIDVGMKWGTALLDPSLKPLVQTLVSQHVVPTNLAQRPYNYGNNDVMKIIVLMTDGENTTEYQLRSGAQDGGEYDFGPSLLYRNTSYSAASTSVNQYSLWDPGRKQYYIFATGKWRATPWGDQVGDQGFKGSPLSQNMPWPDVWQKMSINYFANTIIFDAHGSSTLRNRWRAGATSSPVANTYVDQSAKDPQTLSLCTAAKNQGVRIYTIAFEAPTRGQQLLSECQNSGYYAVDGLDINAAFSGIVNSINKLRLTH